MTERESLPAARQRCGVCGWIIEDGGCKCVPPEHPSQEWEPLVPVSEGAWAMLKKIAKLKNCTIRAALEEAIREFDIKAKA